MSQRKTIIVLLVTLAIGVMGGFALRSIIAPATHTAPVATSSPIDAAPSEARSTQYFVAHVDEARQVVAECRQGAVRGDECANAETAITTVESAERFKRFRER
jgi:hypothetical protein